MMPALLPGRGSLAHIERPFKRPDGSVRLRTDEPPTRRHNEPR